MINVYRQQKIFFRDKIVYNVHSSNGWAVAYLSSELHQTPNKFHFIYDNLNAWRLVQLSLSLSEISQLFHPFASLSSLLPLLLCSLLEKLEMYALFAKHESFSFGRVVVARCSYMLCDVLTRILMEKNCHQFQFESVFIECLTFISNITQRNNNNSYNKPTENKNTGGRWMDETEKARVTERERARRLKKKKEMWTLLWFDHTICAHHHDASMVMLLDEAH